MAKTAANEGIQRQSKYRRSLQSLQVSVDEDRLTRQTMEQPDDKTSLKRKELKAVDNATAGKENVRATGRPKRRTAVDVTYVESPIELKTKSKAKKNTKVKTLTTTKKARPAAVKQNEGKPILNQMKLDFTPVPVSKPKKARSKVAKNEQMSSKQMKLIFSPEDTADVADEKPTIPQSSLSKENKSSSTVKIDEDSGIGPSTENLDQSPMNSTVVLNLKSSASKGNSAVPFIDDLSIITCDTPPLSYWRDLAEQRRIALDAALHENELLHDQLTVLEAENSQLKELVREAENLAQAVRGVLN